MKDIRRKEKAITNKEDLYKILKNTNYITIALCKDNTPYLVSLSHGFDEQKNCIYFHCASEGKKIDYLESNPIVWGQVILDQGYIEGECDHKYASVQFKGSVIFITDFNEKVHALTVMTKQIDKNFKSTIEKHFKKHSIEKVHMGKINIDYLSGKKHKEAILN